MVLVVWCCPCGEVSDRKGHRRFLNIINTLFLDLGAHYPGMFIKLHTYGLGIYEFLHVLYASFKNF